jgi:hypothetical protein
MNPASKQAFLNETNNHLPPNIQNHILMYANENAALLPKSLTITQKRKIMAIILKYVDFTINETDLSKDLKKFLIKFHTAEERKFKTSYRERKERFFHFLSSVRNDSIVVNLPKRMKVSKILFENIFQSVLSFAFREVSMFSPMRKEISLVVNGSNIQRNNNNSPVTPGR